MMKENQYQCKNPDKVFQDEQILIYTAKRTGFIDPVCSMGKSGLIISMYIVKRAGAGSRSCKSNVQYKKSKLCKSKLYRQKNRLYRLNALHRKKRSYKLQPFLFTELILNIKKLGLSFSELSSQYHSKPSFCRSSYYGLGYFESMLLLV